MPRTVFLGTGHFLPERVVTNEELAKRMDTSDEWIQQRTGIRERRHVDFESDPMGASELGTRAARAAMEDAGVTKEDIECIIYATLSPDKGFPGDGVLVQHKLGIAPIPAYDIRNQCSGFLYGLQMADAFIRSGVYKKILLIGAEVHSTGVEFETRGRDVAVLFGDGGGAVVLGAEDGDSRGVLATEVHADGAFAEVLQVPYPSSAAMPRISVKDVEEGLHWPKMEGRLVFKNASTRMPEVVKSVLESQDMTPEDIDMLIPHQANLRISEMVQKRLGLPDDKVFNNIQKYGNTTACSIPLALDEARKSGKVKEGDLVCFAAFGAGFTWGAALVRF